MTKRLRGFTRQKKGWELDYTTLIKTTCKLSGFRDRSVHIQITMATIENVALTNILNIMYIH